MASTSAASALTREAAHGLGRYRTEFGLDHAWLDQDDVVADALHFLTQRVAVRLERMLGRVVPGTERAGDPFKRDFGVAPGIYRRQVAACWRLRSGRAGPRPRGLPRRSRTRRRRLSEGVPRPRPELETGRMAIGPVGWRAARSPASALSLLQRSPSQARRTAPLENQQPRPPGRPS